MENIRKFIEENRKKGFSDVQIRQHLIQNNVLPEQVDVAFCQIPDQKLIDTVRQWFAQGYQLQQVKQSLQQQGYGDAYITLLASKAFEKPRSNHVPLIFASSVFAVIVLAFVVFIFLNSKTEQPLLDVHASAISSAVNPGSQLRFVVDASNFGSTERVDVIYTYRIIGTDISKQETIAVQTSVSKSASIDIPSSLSPGNYDLEVTASYGGSVAKAAFSFIVVASGSAAPVVVDASPDPVFTEDKTCVENWDCQEFQTDCPSSGIKSRVCVDKNFCGTTEKRPTLTEGCAVDPIISCANLPGKLKDNCITKEAKNTKDESLCTTLSESGDCFSAVASAKNSTEICQYISDLDTRDSCLLKVAVQGNSDACGQINSAGLRQACRESAS